jgi:hypothetical protein
MLASPKWQFSSIDSIGTYTAPVYGRLWFLFPGGRELRALLVDLQWSAWDFHCLNAVADELPCPEYLRRGP